MLYLQLAIVLTAFAANSLLCRWALAEYQFDPSWFTLVRLMSGAITLTLLLKLMDSAPSPSFAQRIKQPRFWWLGLALLSYALGFSWAYVRLDTGVGAFILFASVQLIMQLAAWAEGNRLRSHQWLGMVLSLAGLAWLLLPATELPSLSAAAIMVIAALGWSSFVWLGRHSSRPLQDVQQAFMAATFLLLPIFPFMLPSGAVSGQSTSPWVLAWLSGSVASGLGYFLWYRILPQLGVAKAAQFQLLVPVIALLLGMVVLAESVSSSALMAMLLIVSGVSLSTFAATHKDA